MAPIGCVQEPYELKGCPTEITDLDWPRSKELKQDQEMWDWASEINSAEWTLCHVQIAHKIPVVICDHLIKGMLHVMSNFVKASCTGMYMVFATTGGEPCLLYAMGSIKPKCPYNLDKAVVRDECAFFELDI